MTTTPQRPPDPKPPAAASPPQPPPAARPVARLSLWARWGEPDAAVAAVMSQRRREQQAMRAFGRSAGEDPVLRLILASPRWPAYVQHDVGHLRAHVQSLRADVGERWISFALDVDHIRCLDHMLGATVRNLGTAVDRYTGPAAPELVSAWQQCRSELADVPTREIEAAVSSPGDPWGPEPFERWRGQKKVLASYDKYVSCAPDVEGRLAVVAARLGSPVVDALREASSLRAALIDADTMANPVADLRRHGDMVMDWNFERITAFERNDLTVEATALRSATAGKHVAHDPIERLARLEQTPRQVRLPGLSL